LLEVLSKYSDMRRIAILLFLLLFSYTGAAWALEACLGHDRHSDHATVDRHAVSDALVTPNDSREPTVPVIHCTSQNQEVGPADRIASTTIPRPDKASPLHIASLSDVVSGALRNDLSLNAVFRRIVTISLPADRARYLFLSVLQV
jgi:hypothetical protein